MGLFNGFRKQPKPRSPTASDAPQPQQQQQQQQLREQQQHLQQPQHHQQHKQYQQQAPQPRRTGQAEPPAPASEPDEELSDDLGQESYGPREPYASPEPYPDSGTHTPPHPRRSHAPLLASSNSSLYRSANGANPAALISGTSVTNSARPAQGQSPYDVPYGHTRVFIAASYDQVLDRTVACLQHQGFHILASIDLQQALHAAKVQCGDFRRYTVLTACYPKLLFKGIFEEPSLGLLPPSQVVVMEGDFNKHDIVVQITKPSTIYRALHNQSPKLRGILSETDGRLKMALDSIGGAAQDDTVYD